MHDFKAIIEFNDGDLIEISRVDYFAIKRADHLLTLYERERMGFGQPDEKILIISTEAQPNIFPKMHHYVLSEIRKFTFQCVII